MLLSFIFSLAFIGFSFLVTKGVFLPIDHYIDQSLPLVLNSPAFFISRFLAYIYVPLIAIIIALLYKFFLKKQINKILILLTTFSGVIVAEFILKPLFNIPCPQNYYSSFLTNQEVLGLLHALQSTGFFESCYPSSHVASYVVFCGYLAYLTLKHIQEKRQRFIFLSVLIAFIVLVGPSRLYLHAHWFSDVIGGYLLGFALLSLIISLDHKLIR